MRCSELSSPPPQRSEGSKTEGDRAEEEEGVQFLCTEERDHAFPFRRKRKPARD